MTYWIWSGKRGLNPQPPAWKAGALPIELLPHNRRFFRLSKCVCHGRGRPLTMACPALLSVVSQLLSVCVPSGWLRRGATPLSVPVCPGCQASFRFANHLGGRAPALNARWCGLLELHQRRGSFTRLLWPPHARRFRGAWCYAITTTFCSASCSRRYLPMLRTASTFHFPPSASNSAACLPSLKRTINGDCG